MTTLDSSLSTAELTDRYVLGTYGRFPVSFTHGDGSYLWDESGKRYLDFATGIAVCSIGHAPSVIQKALQAQAGKLLHVSNLYQIREQALLAQFLVEEVMQRPGKVFCCNSGAEANDGLIKLARKRAYDRHQGKEGLPPHDIITCHNSFHGRTLGGIAATGQDKVKIGFNPLLPGFLHVPFNDPHALREAVGPNTAAILFEPVQGEGGVHTASSEFLETAAQLRDEFGCLLMFDEIQCGIGRLGDWCGWRALLRDQDLQVEPDAVSWAKGIGGGFPLGAFWVDEALASHLGPGSHGSTFGGTPLASAVALAVLKELAKDEDFANVRAQESRIREVVSSWQSPLIREVRGTGLLLGFVLNPEALQQHEAFVASGKTPSAFIVSEAMKAGLLCVPAGESVVRWLPQLKVASAEVDAALSIFHNLLKSIG